jgi:hypothetical protein
MAQKKSAPRARKIRTRRFRSMIWIVWTVVTGGSVAGWVAPDMPIVGPRCRPSSATSRPRVGEDADAAWVKPQNSQRLPKPTAAAASRPSPTANARPSETRGPIRIASYNIQVFGTSKLAKRTSSKSGQVVRHSTSWPSRKCAAQEDTILPSFIAAINADGSRLTS